MAHVECGAILQDVRPAHLGGAGDPALETPEGRATMKQKIIAGETDQQKRHECTGSVVNVPGIPPSYDYEWFPSTAAVPTDLLSVLEMTCQIYLREADGVVCVSAKAFEEEVITLVNEWFSELKKPWYNVGPLSIDSPKDNSCRAELQEETPVVSFLNRIQSEFGPNSLLYMSLGSVFWPEEQDRVWAVLDGFIAKRQPFLNIAPFSHFSNFQTEMKKKIADSGNSDGVTGWFLTHGGWNSVQEAFQYRVPLIFWPFAADQPYNAMRLSYLKAGFALLEVRTGQEWNEEALQLRETPSIHVSLSSSRNRAISGQTQRRRKFDGQNKL
ncbi:hypothetical protein BT96DRAFT_936180 [Gymnopus androsaceus JB14]|uniref:UDP-Glycosyltransferase/glycogen phosphorylase n=1 Tax=Gymnopus androsaceus JB14 TaxID=1447944 RepID=A0A6A4I2V1_9AGAR|nr:hypothetical protein BT96DRAFT_936180 [Gymnopus androsaceus JB14]